jgi:hypothetical protein
MRRTVVANARCIMRCAPHFDDFYTPPHFPQPPRPPHRLFRPLSGMIHFFPPPSSPPHAPPLLSSPLLSSPPHLSHHVLSSLSTSTLNLQDRSWGSKPAEEGGGRRLAGALAIQAWGMGAGRAGGAAGLNLKP